MWGWLEILEMEVRIALRKQLLSQDLKKQDELLMSVS